VAIVVLKSLRAQTDLLKMLQMLYPKSAIVSTPKKVSLIAYSFVPYSARRNVYNRALLKVALLMTAKQKKPKVTLKTPPHVPELEMIKALQPFKHLYTYNPPNYGHYITPPSSLYTASSTKFVLHNTSNAVDLTSIAADPTSTVVIKNLEKDVRLLEQRIISGHAYCQQLQDCKALGITTLEAVIKHLEHGDTAAALDVAKNGLDTVLRG
jgi:hypothetical protein